MAPGPVGGDAWQAVPRLRLHMAQRRRRTGQVAEWAGHSVAVLLRVYARCIDGQDQITKRRIEDALREPDEGQADDDEHGAT